MQKRKVLARYKPSIPEFQSCTAKGPVNTLTLFLRMFCSFPCRCDNRPVLWFYTEFIHKELDLFNRMLFPTTKSIFTGVVEISTYYFFFCCFLNDLIVNDPESHTIYTHVCGRSVGHWIICDPLKDPSKKRKSLKISIIIYRSLVICFEVKVIYEVNVSQICSGG